jgi:hypothetical protein
MFFSDFVVRNPSCTKPSGKRIELADLLIPFGDTLLTFQVKSKYQPKSASKKSSVDYQRLTDTIDDAVDQVKTINRALKNDWLRGIETVRGFKIDVDPSDVEEVAGVVILDLVGEEYLPPEEQTQLFGSFTKRNDLPIHVFLASEFFTLSSELDTLADFMKFLQITQELYNGNLVNIPPSTLDLLAFHKMDPDALEKAINAGTNILLEEGIWEAYHTHHSEAIAERDRLNEPSYLIDGIIDYLHSSVGYEALPRDQQLVEFSGQGTIEGCLALVREIATLSRLERRSLGERLVRCLNRAMEREEAFSALVLDKEKSGYLVFSKSGDRTERKIRVQMLAAMLYCHLDLEKVIAIATEPMSGEGRSYDVLGFAGTTFKNQKQLAESAKQFFGEPYKITGSEYTEGANPDA